MKNQRRKANRGKRKEMYQNSGAILYKSAKRLESQSRCKERRANRMLRTGIIHAKDAAEYSALTREDFKPCFPDAESSFAHRNTCATRYLSREYINNAQVAMIQ